MMSWLLLSLGVAVILGGLWLQYRPTSPRTSTPKELKGLIKRAKSQNWCGWQDRLRAVREIGVYYPTHPESIKAFLFCSIQDPDIDVRHAAAGFYKQFKPKEGE